MKRNQGTEGGRFLLSRDARVRGVWSMVAKTKKKAAAKPVEPSKEDRIALEVERVKTLLVGVGVARLTGVEKLIDNAAFMAITLEDLQVDINANGCVSEYKNGENQYGTKKSPEVEVYSNLMQRYLAAVKQLIDLLPTEDTPPKDDPLMDFVGGR